ncbi:XrtA/PEP-CTERM system-associated ATPase [Ferrovum myxofaciens]|jgi:putative secretion ATPase (PEP-CTERM system associated)|uniref:AAA family ATPase n=2 Tax=root TaxID=1 RepID=A0A859AAF3_9PROT|nr:XrtA/PEP-CTERM system-associated ATPase [Ferrovum myxofaciens]MBW8028287.1 AAA family ATPase [Ferrovum sp.]KXW58039.1 hypothetical protein FEMY_14360 [Ferrovum myxofaciens]QKE39216.1 MAG: AAA family ATPase [Ferrovum myxofaciens]QWY74471.1 MAG: AAA family ATPase [Ferrovum myxofaciens]QWY77218.1 MAG: AAA family ATPase [Ferrovum myxofaciens]
MYTSFYHLTSKPFQLSPDPGFFFASSGHKRAMSYLNYGLSLGEGFIVITGEVGAGKTLLVRKLFETIGQDSIISTHLVSTHLDADDILRTISGGFGLPHESLSKAVLLNNLQMFFRQSVRQKKRVLIIVDEAQNLTPKAVEELRMLSNYQLDNQSLLQSFLIGQPEFRNTLQSPQMVQLNQRVIASYHLGPLKEEETREYIEHRLHLSGWAHDPTFTPDAFSLIHEFTGGIPRKINTLCDRILVFGMLEEKHQICVEDVDEVIQDLRQEVTHSHDPLPESHLTPLAGGIPDSLAQAFLSAFESRLDRLEATQNALMLMTNTINKNVSTLMRSMFSASSSNEIIDQHDQ